MEEDRAKGKPKTKTKSTTKAQLLTQKHFFWPQFCIKSRQSVQVVRVEDKRQRDDDDDDDNGENRAEEDGDISEKKTGIISSSRKDEPACSKSEQQQQQPPPLISIQLSGTLGKNDCSLGDKSVELQQQQQQAASPGGYEASTSSQQQTALAAANVNDVKRNFIALIRYNKLQYFYLGTLIYSAMNMGFLFYTTKLMKSGNQLGDLNVEQERGAEKIELRHNNVDESSASNTNRFNLILSEEGCTSTNQHRQQQQQQLPHQASGEFLISELYRYFLITLLPLVAILALVVATKAFVFDKHLPTPEIGGNLRTGYAHQAAKISLKRKLASFVQSSGLIVVVFLLCSPFILLNFIDANLTALIGSSDHAFAHSNSTWNLRCDRYQSQAADAETKVDWSWLAALTSTTSVTSALLALVYLQPLLLEGSSGLVKLLGSLLVLPVFISIPMHFLWLQQQSAAMTIDSGVGFNQTTTKPATSNDNSSEPQRRLAAAHLNLVVALFGCLPLALLFGFLKRRHYVRAVTWNTFAGASQLIEAKVSLEHQRQQQETLLLSVLPAYVAEQVKRNMLKKMTTTTTASVRSSSNTDAGEPHGLLAGTSQALCGGISLPVQQSRGLAILTGGLLGGAVGGGESALAPNEPKPACQEAASQPQSASVQVEVQQQQQPIAGRSTSVASAASLRNSFLMSTRFTTSLVSGATLMTGALAGGAPGRAIHQPAYACHQRQQFSANASHYNHHHHHHHHHHHNHQQNAVSIPHQVGANTSTARRGFNELYIRTYNNVSLLYGDIVGFTRLCTQLSSSQLVRVLNDLFSHFDHLAEKHKIMRIKILGDCYYGVSGIPEFAVMGAKSRASRNDNHAINCVNMGLDMIHYIRCLNVERASSGSGAFQQAMSHSASAQEAALRSSAETTGSSEASDRFQSAADVYLPGKRGAHNVPGGCKSAGNCTPMPAFELNMRIGVHTGHIHSGVIGLKKWQFDVWSNDVSIAMHCESSGVPGRVQVTEATVQQLNGAFSYEAVSSADFFLADKEIRTYLIRDQSKLDSVHNTLFADFAPTLMTINANKNNKQVAGKRKKQSVVQTVLEAANIERIDKESLMRGLSEQHFNADNNMDEDNIRAATIGTIRQTLLAGESANSSDALNCYGLAFNHHDMTPYMLNYRDPAIDKLYARRPIKSWLGELLTLILLLGVLIPFIDWHFTLFNDTNESSTRAPSYLNLSNAQIKFLLLILFILILLILINFWKQLFCYAGRDAQREQGDDLYNQTATFDHNNNDENLEGNLATHQVISDKGKCAKKRLSKLSQSVNLALESVRKTMRNISKQLQPVDSLRRSRLKTGTALILFIAVILLQAYLITSSQHRNQLCTNVTINNDSSNNNTQISDKNWMEINSSSEQYQLTVIILLVALDASANLVSFKAKSIFILGILCLQIVITLQPTFIGQQLELTTASYDSVNCNNAEGGYNSSSTNQQVLRWISGTFVFIMALWSLAFARQLEYTNRTNFLWRNRLNVDHEELEYISGINKVLLENILPSHVVQHYLTHPNGQTANSDRLPSLQAYMRMSFSTMRNVNNELYHEQHDSVAVMFASIPHFYEFYDESDISKQGLGCIALLNEIICDFDKLLLKNKFSRIEKIKTIGSTYMAAAGLRPSHPSGSRSSNASQANAPLSTASSQYSFSFRHRVNHPTQTGGSAHETNNLARTSSVTPTTCASLNTDNAEDRRYVMSQQKLNLICMLKFATSLMTALNGINKQSFQVFKLRVGVNAGPVIAGVIGAQRPFYDIWGDCVNIASRMESLGEIGRIQVEEKTAKLLQESSCSESYSIVRRGPIDVKGKGGMVTYFVDKKTASSNNAIDASVPNEPQHRPHKVFGQQVTSKQSSSTCQATTSGNGLTLALSDTAGNRCSNYDTVGDVASDDNNNA